MGRRGPRPRPTALKVQAGVRPDRINSAEPVPPAHVPLAPPTLGEEARRIWHRLAPDLHRRGVLTPWDVDVFALFCDAVVQARRASELVGPALLVRGRRDALVTNPAWRVYRDAVALVRALAQEFGLTPSARSAIRVAVDLSVRGAGLAPESGRVLEPGGEAES